MSISEMRRWLIHEANVASNEYLLRNATVPELHPFFFFFNGRLGVGGHAVPQNCRVSPLEENNKPSPTFQAKF